MSGVSFTLPGALAAAECERLIERATGEGFGATGGDYPPSYRDNDRLVVDDAALAGGLFERLRGELPGELVEGGERWTLVGLNERFRFCRYRGGQRFRVHQDGAHARGPDERSWLTLQVYLDDDPGRVGGRTRFYAARSGREVGAVAPSVGCAVVFDHRLWHDGEPVVRGQKHVLRTDVMYARTSARKSDAGGERVEVLRGHQGYVFGVAGLDDGSLLSCSRDRTLRRWRPGPSGFAEQAALRGHQASIVALAALGPGSVVTASRDHTLRRFDLASGASSVVASLGAAALSLASPGAGALAAGAGDGSITVVREGQAPLRIAAHEGWVWALSALGHGALASASEDGTLRVWDPQSGACLASAAPGRGPLHALAALGDGLLAAGGADGWVRIFVWDAGRSRLDAAGAFAAHEGEVYALSALGEGYLASGGEDAAARVLRVSDGERVAELQHGGFVRAVARVDERTVATGAYDGAVRVWRWR